MSERSKLEERVRNLEREVEELKARVAASDGRLRHKNGPVYSTPVYRDLKDSSQALREAEREAC